MGKYWWQEDVYNSPRAKFERAMRGEIDFTVVHLTSCSWCSQLLERVDIAEPKRVLCWDCIEGANIINYQPILMDGCIE